MGYKLVRSSLLCFFIFGKTMEISLTYFYPYGSGHRDTYLAKNDDGSSPPINIHTSFPYFNQSHRTIYVSIDWLIDWLYINATCRFFQLYRGGQVQCIVAEATGNLVETDRSFGKPNS